MKNDDIRERLKVDNITERCKTEVVWPRPRIRRKKDSGDGTTWKKKEEDRSRDGWTVSTET